MVNIIEFLLFLMESKSQYRSMQSTGSRILHGSSVIRKEYNCAWERNWGQTIAETLKGSTLIEKSRLCLCRTRKFSNSKKLKLCYFCGHFCHWYSFCSLSLYIKLVEVYEVFFPPPFAYKIDSMERNLRLQEGDAFGREALTEEDVPIVLQKRWRTLETVSSSPEQHRNFPNPRMEICMINFC